MKKIVFIFLIVVFSCKNENKQIVDSVEDKLETPKEVITKVNFAAFPAWGKIGVEIKQTSEMYLGEEVYLMSRDNESTKSSYAQSRKIPVDYENSYRASVIAKKTEKDSLLGLRIIGGYPDMVDAVFNLNEGTVKGVQKTRDFESENATIEVLGDGWYKCTVSAKLVTDEVKIFLGPTTGNKNIRGWTIRTPDDCGIYILPSSLTLEKVSTE